MVLVRSAEGCRIAQLSTHALDGCACPARVCLSVEEEELELVVLNRRVGGLGSLVDVQHTVLTYGIGQSCSRAVWPTDMNWDRGVVDATSS